ncbi:MAG: hypothetical protein SGJ07_11075 [Rhodospirillaceae bacterium]|nr:hypothetical protein [Rhodospirillaceae bacterium]
MPRLIACAAFLLTAIGLVGGAMPAAASPQVLGLMASSGLPVPLTCQSGECTAHLSTFCLQEARDAPSHGQSYQLAEGSRMTIVVERHDGSYTRLEGSDLARMTALVGFTSVRIAIPTATIAALDGARAWIEVAPRASLIPVAEAGDFNPQSEAEIALATGAYRDAAALRFEAPGMTGDAARLTNLLINSLPPGQREDDVTRDGLWMQTVTADMTAQVTDEGLAKAKELYNYCRMSSEAGTALTMRDCLTLRHADLMGEENREFWKEVGGS